MTDIARSIVHRKYQAYIFVNNRMEGFAPAAIEAVSQGLLF